MRWLLLEKVFPSRVCGVQASSANKERMLPCLTPIWGENDVPHSHHMLCQDGKISVQFVFVKCSSCQKYLCCWHERGVRIKPLKWLWFCLGIKFIHTAEKTYYLLLPLEVHKQTSLCFFVSWHFQNNHFLFLQFFYLYFGGCKKFISQINLHHK